MVAYRIHWQMQNIILTLSCTAVIFKNYSGLTANENTAYKSPAECIVNCFYPGKIEMYLTFQRK